MTVSDMKCLQVVLIPEQMRMQHTVFCVLRLYFAIYSACFVGPVAPFSN